VTCSVSRPPPGGAAPPWSSLRTRR
jgi:hypothetical protein